MSTPIPSHPWVAKHVAALPKSGIRDFFELVAALKGQGVISLGVGEPDFVTPQHIRDASIAALQKGSRPTTTSSIGSSTGPRRRATRCSA